MEYNDYELLEMIKEKNEDAMAILYNKYEPLFNKKIKKVYNILRKKGIEYEDIKQECLLGFENAINYFDSNEDTLFYTFANVCIDRQLKNLIAKQTRDKYRVLNEAISLDVLNNEGQEVNLLDVYVPQKSNPENDLLLEEDKNELEFLIKNQLTDFEQLIFDMKMQGFTYKEIEQIIEKDSKTVYNAAQRIKNKIIKILENR